MRRREQLRDLRERVRATRSGRLTLQIVVGLIGAVVIAVGIILIPFPGPGWLIVLFGLAILAAEFAWANRLMVYTRDRLESWWHWLGRQIWWVRLLVGVSGIAFVTLVVWLSLRLSLGVRSLSDVWEFLRTH